MENQSNEYKISENKYKLFAERFSLKFYSNFVNAYKNIKMSKEEKNILKKNEEFKNKYKGKRCFIVGNGPSLKSVDLKKLENEIVFTVNQLPRMEKFEDIKTDYHIWSDERFFKKQDKEIINVIRKTNVSSNPICFFPYSIKKFIIDNKIDKHLNVRFFDGNGGALYHGYKKNIDCTKIMPLTCTVVVHGISFAIYMGFKEIYLLGCDCTGFVNLASLFKSENTDNLEYGYEIDEKERNRLKKTCGSEIKFELKNYAKLFDDYEILDEYCQRKDIQLVNCTEGGLLYSIERKSLDEVLNE